MNLATPRRSQPARVFTARSPGSARGPSLSYDRFRERYVLTPYGIFDDDQGRLTLSNVETGTSWSGYGMTFHDRNAFFDITADGIKVEQETSIDGGESWFVNAQPTCPRTTE